MKTGRRWGDAAAPCPWRPREGAQLCNTSLLDFRPLDSENTGPQGAKLP